MRCPGGESAKSILGSLKAQEIKIVMKNLLHTALSQIC